MYQFRLQRTDGSPADPADVSQRRNVLERRRHALLTPALSTLARWLVRVRPRSL